MHMQLCNHLLFFLFYQLLNRLKSCARVNRLTYMDIFSSSQGFPVGLSVLLLIVQVWTIVWKAIALFRAARADQKYWFALFIVLLPLNDLGIVALIYLFFFAKNKLTIQEIKMWLHEVFNFRKKKRT